MHASKFLDLRIVREDIFGPGDQSPPDRVEVLPAAGRETDHGALVAEANLRPSAVFFKDDEHAGNRLAPLARFPDISPVIQQQIGQGGDPRLAQRDRLAAPRFGETARFVMGEPPGARRIGRCKDRDRRRAARKEKKRGRESYVGFLRFPGSATWA